MNFYSANGNLIKKELEILNENKYIKEEYTSLMDINTSKDTYEYEPHYPRVRKFKNDIIKKCGIKFIDLDPFIIQVNNLYEISEIHKICLSKKGQSKVCNQYVEDKNYIRTKMKQHIQNMKDDDRKCVLEKLEIFDDENKCINEGYISCSNKAEEEACKAAGYTSCDNKVKEEACKSAGYTSCNNKVKEEACKSAGFKSCAHKAEEEASGISNNLIVIIGLLVLIYFIFNKSN